MNQRDSRSLEQRVVADLWTWWRTDDATRETNWPPKSPFAVKLEFYLCKLFRLIPLSQSSGWWCDGVTKLSLPEFNPKWFQFLGVAYVMDSDTCFLEPFELEFYFQEVDDIEPLRVILKIGDGIRPRVPYQNPSSSLAVKALENRPRRNCDWTIAVTLTSEES